MSAIRPRALATIHLGAITHNSARLRELAGGTAVMAMVKANAYGHGAVQTARAAVAGGANWLGVATIEEGLELRAGGLTEPILVLLTADGDPIEDAVRAGLHLCTGSIAGLADIAAAARHAGTAANVQLEFDTGLGRGGAPEARWIELLKSAADMPELSITGLWSHLARADEVGHKSVGMQVAGFDTVLKLAADAGFVKAVRHLANSAGAIGAPATRFDLIRPGVSLYGISPSADLGSESDLGLRPAMTLTSYVAEVKEVTAGHGVSYGHEYRTTEPTQLALIPVGYADAVPRSGGNRIEVAIDSKRYRAAGRISMDQFVIDVGSDSINRGDVVHLFGPGDHGEVTAREFADQCGTIAYEIFTGLGHRVTRVWS